MSHTIDENLDSSTDVSILLRNLDSRYPAAAGYYTTTAHRSLVELGADCIGEVLQLKVDGAAAASLSVRLGTRVNLSSPALSVSSSQQSTSGSISSLSSPSSSSSSSRRVVQERNDVDLGDDDISAPDHHQSSEGGYQ